MGLERCPSVDVLRAIAALSVAWFHFTNGQPLFLEPDSLLKLSGAYGYLGVSVFFVISGFVIPYSLDGVTYRFPRDTGVFFKRRFWRLYPPYIAAVIITVCLLFASQLIPSSRAIAPTVDLRAIVGHLTYTVPWLGADWYSAIYWSLAIEVQFYAAMALFAPVLLSRNKIVLSAALFVVACLSFLSRNETLLFRYLPIFGIGFCWFMYFTKRTTVILAAAQASGLALIIWIKMGPAHALAGVFAFAALSVPVRKPIPVLTFIGTISYSIYLLHSPIGGRVINLATRLPSTLPVQLAALTFAMIASLASAYLLWHFVESAQPKRDPAPRQASDVPIEQD